MSLLGTILEYSAAVVVVGLVGRASLKLLQNPEQSHDQLVPARERHATTLAGSALMLVGAWTLRGGGVTLPVHPFTLLLPGIVLFVYPDFAPTHL